jgi:hypothetical protein
VVGKQLSPIHPPKLPEVTNWIVIDLGGDLGARSATNRQGYQMKWGRKLCSKSFLPKLERSKYLKMQQ